MKLVGNIVVGVAVYAIANTIVSVLSANDPTAEFERLKTNAGVVKKLVLGQFFKKPA